MDPPALGSDMDSKDPPLGEGATPTPLRFLQDSSEADKVKPGPMGLAPGFYRLLEEEVI